MKKIVSLFSIIILIAGFIFTGCKKENSLVFNENKILPEVSVKNGILRFADNNAYEAMSKKAKFYD